MNSWLKILLLLFAYSILSKSSAQDYVVNYQHLQTKDGLANAFVNCAMQDKEGFMWFGTNDGLCRYDGQNFLTFRNDEEKGIFLGSNAVQDIIQLDDRYLLIGTTAGLSKLDLYTHKISTIVFFNQKNILSIFIDSQKTIWIIADEQLFFRKSDTKEWEKYSAYQPEFAKKQITGIYEYISKKDRYLIIYEKIIQKNTILIKLSYQSDKDKKWKTICTTPFLASYFKNSDIWFSHIKRIQNEEYLHQVYDTSVFKVHVLENKPNIIVKLGKPFSSSLEVGDYLYSYNSESVLLIDYKKNKITKTIDWNKTSLNTNKYGIVFIYKDRTNNLWICTYGAGIAVVPIYTLFSIEEYKYNENNQSKSLSGASVRVIYQDKKSEDIWIGTYNNTGNIDIFNK